MRHRGGAGGSQRRSSLLNNKVSLVNLRCISTTAVEMQRRLTGLAGLL
jgi:hypothetical protein